MKPDLALNQLDREPLVYFGCTWTEIKAALYQSAVVVVLALVGLLLVYPSPLLIAIALLGWLGLAYALLRHIHRFRAGKPLHYERHRKTARRAPFIQPGRCYHYGRGLATRPRISR